ncbi:hypothetical protein WJX75_006961 [Coccomyxa subellipsoidea]|uniref:SAP domain-containing protein n=1 Tax=Coccomyxa subellipsoidea TaxID=248742 RepID=A0ABR2YRQ6_9CHLO
MKVQELRDELEKRSLDTSGLKATLIERLEEAMKADTAAEPAAEPISTATLTNGSDSAQPAIEAPVEEKTHDASAEAAAQAGKIVFEDSNAAELEKRKARAARFGVPLNTSEDEKKDSRAQRFGITEKPGPEKRKASEPISSKKAASLEELAALLEKKKARAARFNVPLVTTSKEETLRLKSRAERFKDQLSSAPVAKAPSAKDTPQSAAAAEFEAKKKARAERFKVAA